MAMSSEYYIQPYSPSELTAADVTINYPPTPLNTLTSGQYGTDYNNRTVKLQDEISNIFRFEEIIVTCG